MPKKKKTKTLAQTIVVGPTAKLVTLTNTFQNYVVEKSTDLTVWTPVYTSDNGAHKIEIWDIGGDAAAFYRVREGV